MTTLNLSFKGLTSVPPEISELKNLTELYISENQITLFPLELTELKNLTKLVISRNELTSLPPEISELKNLTELDVSYNRLTSLPPEISELKKLTNLNLARNQLSSLPPEISELKKLTNLNLARNRLTLLPAEISQLKDLNNLNVYNNQLISLLPEISELKNLNELNISSNQLVSLPSEICKLKNLTKFNISYNQLTSLPHEISELKKLNELYLSYNDITSLPPEIFKLKNLTELYISDNKLTFLPPEALELKLEIEWEDMSKANKIFLKGNPFEYPPIEIVKKGTEAIKNYFTQLETKPLNEVKILLVGEGGAGKTSLVKKLFGENIDGNEPQTKGISIRKKVIQSKEREIKANFWDFGGQEIMQSTHQFFLSKRSIYILVLDGRKDEKPEYWLKLIENFGGDSPILVVINKIDENPAFDMNRKFLREKYPSIKGFYRLSCVSSDGIEEFSKSLEEEMRTAKNIEILWPKSWFNIKKKLEDLRYNCTSDSIRKDEFKRCNFIEYNQYKTFCEDEEIKSESEQNTLVDFLHDLGVILHFRDIPLLNTYVLEPEWVTNAVYKIINSKKLVDQNGVLDLGLLSDILEKERETDFHFPDSQYSFIVNLMKKFELCYEIDSKTVLIPDLLKNEEPEFTFNNDDSLKFIFDYNDFLPKPVIPRFIVRLNKDIKNDLRWKTGVVLEDKNFNSSALIKADTEAKKIYVYVNGEQRRDYFSVILFNFRKINEDFKKLEVIERVPIPLEPKITVSYKHLIRLENKGIKKYPPDGSDKEYDVRDLLGTVKLDIEEMTNENILRILRKLEDERDTEETLIIKFLKAFSLGIGPVGIDLSELAKMVKTRKK